MLNELQHAVRRVVCLLVLVAAFSTVDAKGGRKILGENDPAENPQTQPSWPASAANNGEPCCTYVTFSQRDALYQVYHSGPL
eukprot:5947707-Pyramimonas_sp.AAC.2